MRTETYMQRCLRLRAEVRKPKAPRGTHIHLGQIVPFVPYDAVSNNCPFCGKVMRND
jgi:hypothetical protein